MFADDVTDILGEVAALVTGERNDMYGPPAKNLGRTADMWAAILDRPITEQQVALCLAAMKIAREAHRHNDDNILDAIGYLTIYQAIVKKPWVREEDV